MKMRGAVPVDRRESSRCYKGYMSKVWWFKPELYLCRLQAIAIHRHFSSFFTRFQTEEGSVDQTCCFQLHEVLFFLCPFWHILQSIIVSQFSL